MTSDPTFVSTVLAAGQPGDRPPAPAGLALVQAFLNTTDREDRIDQLRDLAGLQSWLLSNALPGADLPLREGDRRRLVAFREGVRALVMGRDHGGIDPAALTVVNDAAREAKLTVAFDRHGEPALEPVVRGLDALVARLVADITAASMDGTWVRLKVCPRTACGWAFYDASKNRSGRWCAMAVCGNRTKSARSRARRSGATELDHA
ncbi:MAG TPA: CGNR zinc finger domain-containing protein [Candidatus Limnocylindrales bacterium]